MGKAAVAIAKPSKAERKASKRRKKLIKRTRFKPRVPGVESLKDALDFQQDAIEQLATPAPGFEDLTTNRRILALRTGAGKTMCALRWWNTLTDADRLIWFVPNDTIENTCTGIRALGYTGPLNVLAASANRRSKDGVWDAYTIPTNGILVVGWDTLQFYEYDIRWWAGVRMDLRDKRLTVDPDRLPREKWPKWAQKTAVDQPAPSTQAAIVFDEAQLGKSPERWTKDPKAAASGYRSFSDEHGVRRWPLRTRAAGAARLAEGVTYALGMTASTVTESRHDVFCITRLIWSEKETARLLNLHRGYLYAFREKYCGAVSGAEKWLVDGEDTNQDELLQCWNHRVLVVPNPEMVERHFRPIHTRVHQVPRKAWKDRKSPWLRDSDKQIRAAMERAPSVVKPIKRVAREYRSMLIFTEHVKVCRYLGMRLGCLWITGETKAEHREMIKMQHELVGGLLIATVHSLGRGHNMQYVDALGCAEMPDQLDMFLQPLGRGQRLLRDSDLDLHMFTVDGTRDVHTLMQWERKLHQTRAFTPHDTTQAQDTVDGGMEIDWADMFAQAVAREQ